MDDLTFSAGLIMWTDVNQPPGSIAPDGLDFMQQVLTKDPKQRPSAAELLSHPWLERNEKGEPWRDPDELAAALAANQSMLTTAWNSFCAGAQQLAGVGDVRRWSMPFVSSRRNSIVPIGDAKADSSRNPEERKKDSSLSYEGTREQSNTSHSSSIGGAACVVTAKGRDIGFKGSAWPSVDKLKHAW
eukprot:jgi/Chrzof1/4424/Cz14g12180.t1